MLLSRRWHMVLLLVSGVMASYTLRVNMSVAAVAMARALQWTGLQKGIILSAFYVGYAIGQLPSAFITHSFGARRLFGLSILVTGILSVIFPAVIKQSFVNGVALRVLTGVAASAVFPSCYYFYKSWVPLPEKTVIIPTVGAGVYLGEIICFSACGVLVQTDFSFYGLSVGGWPSNFWIFGLLAICWYPYWMFHSYEKPEDDPLISVEELSYIKQGQTYNTLADFNEEQELLIKAAERDELQRARLRAWGSGNYGAISHGSGDENIDCAEITNTSAGLLAVTAGSEGPSSPRMVLQRRNSIACSILSDTKENSQEVARRIPWGQFLLHPTSRTLLLTWWVVAWIGLMMLSEIPTYLTQQLGYDIDEAGFLSILPYCAQFISSIGFGHVFTHLQLYHGWSTRDVRQCAQFLCLGGSGICLVLCSYMTSVCWAVWFLILALFFHGATQAGLSCVFLDVSPNYSCSLNSLANMVGALAGILSPLTVSMFTTTSFGRGADGWKIVFWLTALQCAVALYFWYHYQTSDVIPVLNSPRPKKTVKYREWFPWLRV